MNILLTGGAGYIGSHLYVKLRRFGLNPVIVDNLSNSSIDMIDRFRTKFNDVIFYNVDCKDGKQLDIIFKKEKIDIVIHLAALKNVAESISKSNLYYNNNVNATVTILDVMKNNNVKNIIFSSTASLYKSSNHGVSETDEIGDNLSPYAKSKLITESIIKEYCGLHGIRAIILRYFNPIGNDDELLVKKMVQDDNTIQSVISKNIITREPIVVYGNTYTSTPDGSPARDFVNINDLTRAHIMSMIYLVSQDNGFYEIFNVGCGTYTTIFQLINELRRIVDHNVEHVIGEKREGDIAMSYASIKKIGDKMKWYPVYTIKDSLISIINRNFQF
jgi:UDP-glucose 4-epimerase